MNSFTALPIHLPLISGRVGSLLGRVVENLPAAIGAGESSARKPRKPAGRAPMRGPMLQCSREACCIPFNENMTIQIFSFSFRSLPSIDAVILAGIPSRQIR